MDKNEIMIKDKLEPKRLLKVALFDQRKTSTKPHKHNGYLELVYLSHTSGKHTIDTREIVVKAPCLLVIRQDNVHFWELERPVEGYVVLLKREFVERSLDQGFLKLLEQISGFDQILLKDDTSIYELLTILAKEENPMIQEALFKAVLLKTLENLPKPELNLPRNNNLFDRFVELIGQSRPIVNHVAHYAEILNTSPQNLNASCKKRSGKTASQVLSEHILKEAQRLLLYTGKSISEIAYALGFSDKSHFSKYFKRNLGIRAKDFRLQQA